MGIEETGWSILGTVFRCARAPAEVRRDLEVLLEGFQNGCANAENVVHFQVLENEGSTHLTFLDDRSDPKRLQLTSPAGADAEYRLICEALNRVRDRFVLHAAAVASPRGTCLITGESESGKTTLALSLWSQGMELISDDLCPIAYDSLALEVFPRAPHVDGHRPAAFLEAIPASPPSYPPTHYPFRGRAGSKVPPVRTILALDKGGPEDGVLVPLTQSEAAHRVLQSSIRTPHFRFTDALESASRISSSCRAYRLRASSVQGAASRAIQLLIQ